MNVGGRNRCCAAALAVVLGACTEGYPTGSAQARATAEDRVRVINGVLRAHPGSARSVALPHPCTLAVTWEQQPTAAFRLLELETLVDTEAGSGQFVVHLRNRGAAAASPLFLNTPDWVQLAVVRAELNQLRAHCAEAQQAPAGPTPSG